MTEFSEAGPSDEETPRGKNLAKASGGKLFLPGILGVTQTAAHRSPRWLRISTAFLIFFGILGLIGVFIFDIYDTAMKTWANQDALAKALADGAETFTWSHGGLPGILELLTWVLLITLGFFGIGWLKKLLSDDKNTFFSSSPLIFFVLQLILVVALFVRIFVPTSPFDALEKYEVSHLSTTEEGVQIHGAVDPEVGIIHTLPVDVDKSIFFFTYTLAIPEDFRKEFRESGSAMEKSRVFGVLSDMVSTPTGPLSLPGELR